MIEVPVRIHNVIDTVCPQLSDSGFDFPSQLRQLVVHDEHAVVPH